MSMTSGLNDGSPKTFSSKPSSWLKSLKTVRISTDEVSPSRAGLVIKVVQGAGKAFQDFSSTVHDEGTRGLSHPGALYPAW